MLRRAADVLLAGSLLVPAAALFGLGWWRRSIRAPARPVRGRRIELYGRMGETCGYRVRLLYRRGHPLWCLNYVGALAEVLAGRLSLVGPRPVLRRRRRPRYAGFAARPGLIGPAVLRRRANLAFEIDETADAEFVRTLSMRTYLGVLARFAWSLLQGSDRRPMPRRFELLGVAVDNVTMAQALETVRTAIERPVLTPMAFVNADCLNIAHRDRDYRAALGRAACVFADGIGIHYALKLFSPIALRENVNGTDMFPRLCAMLEREGRSLFLLGARPEVADRVATLAQRKFPRLRIVGTQHGHFPPEQTGAVVDRIAALRPDVLLVAMGAPRQELWIDTHRERLGARVAIGVGGLFDFYSGSVARAPQWMRELGLEWLYRLLQEPGRMWRRYLLGNPLFLYRAWRQMRRRST